MGASPNVLVRPRTAPARCAVCHDEMALVQLDTCLRCGSATHEECRAALAGCPTLACPDAYRRAIVLRVPGARHPSIPVRLRPLILTRLAVRVLLPIGRAIDQGLILWRSRRGFELRVPIELILLTLIVGFVGVLCLAAQTVFREPRSNTFNAATRRISPPMTEPIGG